MTIADFFVEQHQHHRLAMRLGVRAQLTLWYTAVFALLILLFSIILYTTLQASQPRHVGTYSHSERSALLHLSGLSCPYGAIHKRYPATARCPMAGYCGRAKWAGGAFV